MKYVYIWKFNILLETREVVDDGLKRDPVRHLRLCGRSKEKGKRCGGIIWKSVLDEVDL